MTALPAELAYGRVVGRWVLPVAGDPTAPEASPVKKAPTGKVNFIRLDVSAIALDAEQADGTYVGIVRKKVTAELDETGEMFLEGQDGPGFLLAEGAYQVEPAFSEVNWPSFPIVVTAAHTSEAPLDVLKSSPILSSPTVIAAPSLETAERAEAAAASALASETNAEASADEAMSSELASAANASSAAGSAATASSSEAAAAGSAAAAAGSATAASDSATAASDSATAASDSATAASDSASSASGSALAAAGSADAAGASAATASAAQGAASTARGAAEAARDAAGLSAGIASSAAADAAGSADAAAGSASDAAASSAEAQAWVTNHEAAADPHSQYLNNSRGDARYAAPTGTDDRLQVNGVDVEPEQVGAQPAGDYATAEQGDRANMAYAATPVMTQMFALRNKTAISYGNSTIPFKVSLVSGHKYFTRATVAQLSGTPATITGRISVLTGGTTVLLPGVGESGGVKAIPGAWSHITTPAIDYTDVAVYMYGGNSTDPGIVEFTDVSIIDLTAAFGAGNEPSKDQMDAILDSLGGWFDGEKAISLYPLVKYLSDFNWIGNGSPYGVLIPHSKGIEYRDLDQTNGARKWISTGTTNTSWVVTDGDTGWRIVSGGLLNGWADRSAGSFQIRIRRRNTTVILVSRTLGLNAANATANTFLPLFSGFKPSPAGGTYGSLGIAGVGMTLSSEMDEIKYSGTGYMMIGFSTNRSYEFEIHHETDDPWPTILPGTPG